MDGRRGLKRACANSDDDEPELTPQRKMARKRGRPPGSRKSLPDEQTPQKKRGRPPGSRKSLAADETPQKLSHAADQTPVKTPKSVNFLEGLEENEGATPQSFFRVKEGSGVGKRLANKIADIGIVEEQDLRDAIAILSPKHEKEQAVLLDSYRTFYHKWHFQLRCGFGLLMYGFGSKKKLLEDFAGSELRDGAAVIVNGYLSNVNIKHVVYTVVNTLWDARRKGKPSKKDKQNSPQSSNSLVDLLGFLADDEDSTHIYVIIHNIDGPGLRDDDVQQTFASLASSKHVRLVASIDNINAPILWDKQMARNQFKWLWLHTPTYASYEVEGTSVPLLLAVGTATKSARSAILVLRSLTPNAQSVFRVLAEFQISHPEDQGLPLNRLYTACREQFLVSSEVTLRAHLTEFKDHELLKFRRGVDGQDCLYIPLPNEALSKLLEDITS